MKLFFRYGYGNGRFEPSSSSGLEVSSELADCGTRLAQQLVSSFGLQSRKDERYFRWGLLPSDNRS